MSVPLRCLPAPGSQGQRGMSLLFALVALVILGLGAVALTRSVDTSTLVMGNLVLRQDAVTASAAAAEQAMAWLEARRDSAALDANDETAGYYASSLDTLDVTGNRTSASRRLPLVDWDDNDCAGREPGSHEHCSVRPATGASVNGHRVQWVILRLCERPGEPAGGSNPCLRPAGSSTGTTHNRGELSESRAVARVASAYYRIVVRVQGPRNTVSFTEATVHF